MTYSDATLMGKLHALSAFLRVKFPYPLEENQLDSLRYKWEMMAEDISSVFKNDIEFFKQTELNNTSRWPLYIKPKSAYVSSD